MIKWNQSHKKYVTFLFLFGISLNFLLNSTFTIGGLDSKYTNKDSKNNEVLYNFPKAQDTIQNGTLTVQVIGFNNTILNNNLIYFNGTYQYTSSNGTIHLCCIPYGEYIFPWNCSGYSGVLKVNISSPHVYETIYACSLSFTLYSISSPCNHPKLTISWQNIDAIRYLVYSIDDEGAYKGRIKLHINTTETEGILDQTNFHKDQDYYIYVVAIFANGTNIISNKELLCFELTIFGIWGIDWYFTITLQQWYIIIGCVVGFWIYAGVTLQIDRVTTVNGKETKRVRIFSFMGLIISTIIGGFVGYLLFT